MAANHNQDLEKYLQDIATIKDLLSDVDKRPLYEPWIFYVWGGLAKLYASMIGSSAALVFYLLKIEHHALSLMVGSLFAVSLITAGFTATGIKKKEK